MTFNRNQAFSNARGARGFEYLELRRPVVIRRAATGLSAFSAFTRTGDLEVANGDENPRNFNEVGDCALDGRKHTVRSMDCKGRTITSLRLELVLFDLTRRGVLFIGIFRWRFQGKRSAWRKMLTRGASDYRRFAVRCW